MSYHNSLSQPLPPYAPEAPSGELCWNARYQLKRRLGHGAQGVVYLARREGVDGYYTNVALKLFYRNPTLRAVEYHLEMRRIATQAQRVSGLQHDNLVNIRDFVALGETRVMVLEWIDGLDLAQLLDLRRLEQLRRALPRQTWDRLNDVIVTTGEDHGRLKPGIAVDILRGCLAGLSPLHHDGIVHCDLKPSNIMIKRTGIKKIIDVDSSCVPAVDPPHVRGTPYYMAPELLRGKPPEVRSDIASLGYVLIEMLTGSLLFRECDTLARLLEAKLKLPSRLEAVLPQE
ncbi:MAG: serine/threonine-protein kinase, partial [Anaerolineales bacterium]